MSETIEMNIDGMTSADCVKQVTDAIQNVPGVQLLEVGIGTARIALEDESSKPAVVDAVRQVGFEPSFS